MLYLVLWFFFFLFLGDKNVFFLLCLLKNGFSFDCDVLFFLCSVFMHG